MHVGFPWVKETGYLAATSPHVHVDLSEMTLWAPGQLPGVLTELIGWLPTDKILHGSDMLVERKQGWLAASFTHPVLERTLHHYVKEDYPSSADALRAGQQMVGGNARRVHTLGWLVVSQRGVQLVAWPLSLAHCLRTDESSSRYGVEHGLPSASQRRRSVTSMTTDSTVPS